MEAQLEILQSQMVTFVTLLVIGYLSKRCGLLSDAVIDAMSALVVRLIMPAVILSSLPGAGTRRQLFSMWRLLLAAALMYGFLFFLGWGSAKLLRLPQPTRNVHIAVTGLPNSAFMGYPLLFLMFPAQTPLFMASYMLLDATMLWVVTPLLLNPAPGGEKRDLRMLLSPGIISLLVAMVLLLLQVQPRDNVVWDVLDGIAGMNQYVALIYIGASIGRKGLLPLLKRKSLYLVLPLKLVAAPFCVYFLLSRIGFLDPVYVMMLAIMSMMPSMVTICMQAKEFGSDDEYASGGLLLTTVCSLFTMPLVMQQLLKL